LKISPGYQGTIVGLVLLGGAPAVVVAVGLAWTAEISPVVRWAVSLVVPGIWLFAVRAVRERTARPLQSLANALAALREGDFSLRARLGDPDDPLGLLAHEVNEVANLLRGLRGESLEATALLGRVMEEIDVAIFAFDAEEKVVFANRAAGRLLDRSADRLAGRSAEELGLARVLRAETPRIEQLTFPGRSSRWEVRTRRFRQAGKPHRLLLLSDLSRVLREEERKAWQRLVRVLSHEINNSLTPIHSIAQSLHKAVDGSEAEQSGDLARGLGVIAARAKALTRFLSSYARLARLPDPRLEPVDVGTWVRRVAGLETRIEVAVEEGPPAEVRADGDQLDQLLINLIDNAVDASLETDGGVRVGWSVDRHGVEVRVEDDGPGIPSEENLFVPFFTTKPDGSGIGLVLSRQIAEAHDGTLTLKSREGGEGAVARVRLPKKVG